MPGLSFGLRKLWAGFGANPPVSPGNPGTAGQKKNGMPEPEPGRTNLNKMFPKTSLQS